jgi:2-polyprenyl-3-methyl-5-hydroxy-6-metoxy-1,4-benzoquinol methylase
MTTMTMTGCAVCGSADASRPLLAGSLAECSRCGFVWTAAEPAQLEDLYGAGYFCGDAYEDYLQPSARRFEAARRLSWLLRTRRISSLVEAGCAGGFFVEAAIRAGIAAAGVELSPELAAYAREQLRLPVCQGRFEATTLEAPVQAVCAFHVLEHVEDPNAFVRTAWKLLEPGGLLAVEVPNIASPAARRLGPDWPGLQPRYHRWHFGPTSLRRLVERHGFEVVVQDTAVFRYYMPGRFRRRRARHLLAADVRNTHSIRLTHRRSGDLLRMIAQRPHRTSNVARRRPA